MVTPTVVFAGLIGAIAWNLATWYLGLPSSSSHALIGGVVGSAVAASGLDAVFADGLVGKVLVPAVVAPVLAFVVAGLAIGISYRVVGGERPGTVTRGFRFGQIVSGGLLALAHGTNDAQKTMGVITLALIANGTLAEGSDPPTWVIVAAASAIALGTYSGGWRIIRTTGTRIIKMDAAQGFSAQGAGAAVILASTHFGFPLSTTHVINGGVMGAGAAKRLSAVRWGVAGNIVVAWLLTLPAAAAIGAADLRIHQHLRQRRARPGSRHRRGPVPRRPRIRPALAAGRAGPGELMAVVVETKELWQTVVASIVAGVGITSIFSVAIWSAARFVDFSRDDRPIAAGAAAALGLLALAATAAAVVVGIVVMANG